MEITVMMCWVSNHMRLCSARTAYKRGEFEDDPPPFSCPGGRGLVTIDRRFADIRCPPPRRGRFARPDALARPRSVEVGISRFAEVSTVRDGKRLFRCRPVARKSWPAPAAPSSRLPLAQDRLKRSAPLLADSTYSRRGQDVTTANDRP